LVADPPANSLAQPSVFKELAESSLELTVSARSALWSAPDPVPALFEVKNTVQNLAIGDTKAAVRKLIPGALATRIRTYRSLSGDTASWYLKLQVERALKIRRDGSVSVKTPLCSVLFICHGNIIRSPMAAAVLRRLLSDSGHSEVRVSSAGHSAKPGRPADPRAVLAAREYDLSLEEHRAQLLTPALMKSADLVFVMDYINEAKVLAQHSAAKSKLFLLATTPRRTDEIHDPYNGTIDDVRQCYAEIVARVHDLFPKLFAGTAHRSAGETSRV
jgi:protein-tyrosine phosphatase